MGKIILELQAEAINPDTNTIALFRKAYLIADKLGLDDFKEWLNNELNGYNKDSIYPSYRVITGEMKFYHPYYGWRPVIWLGEGNLYETLTKREVSNSLHSLTSQSSSSDFDAYMKYPPDVSRTFKTSPSFETEYALFIGRDVAPSIIECARNKLLEWALLLEKNGILGEELQFSEEEKAAADAFKTVYNINNFFGNAENVQIQQDSKNSNQNHTNNV